jgi:hypothetical protein
MQLSEMPPGYHAQVYDDCGVRDRQPHAVLNNCATFAPETVQGDEKARTVTFGVPNFDMIYDGLDSRAVHVLAVTYASEKGNRRVQSLSAGRVTLHGPRLLPDGTTERLLFQIPADAFENGRLLLHFILNEGPNAVVSVVELWAPRPSPKVLHVTVAPRISRKLAGRVLNLTYDGEPGAPVVARDAATGREYASCVSGADGAFEMDLSAAARPGIEGNVEVTAGHEGIEAKARVAFSDLCFEAPRYRPIPDRVGGLRHAVRVLDGTWRIHPAPPEGFQTQPTDGPDWKDFTAPGQWLQQGYDVPRDKRAGIARDFHIPKAWAEKRVILRFDAVHAGTDYWLNGTRIGHSENLFTPVEFDVTEAARSGDKNHLALSMTVSTPSELASFASDYAYHNLGGIDRSVRLFALPAVHIARLHYETTLDAAYRDATLQTDLTIENTTAIPVTDLSARIGLTGPDDKLVPLEDSDIPLREVNRGATTVSKLFAVQDPLKWSAEKPHLYRLRVALRRAGTLLERVDQPVGFRTVEARDGQVRINGRPIKLAGVCRHEIDPLKGRAGTAEHAEADAALLRAANFNFIRTSHYPPTREFLDACDRLGLYVECEAPFCWARNGHGEDDPGRTKTFLTPTAAMIEYHRDHPSVILWSLGNESGNGPEGEDRLPANFAATRELCRTMAPSRLTIFNNEWNKDGRACDVACLHYPPFPPEEYRYVKDDPRPLMLDEYFPPQTFVFAEELDLNPGLDVALWSTGQNDDNSYWSRLYRGKRTLGGSIWAGIDEQFIFADGKVLGYGPWGFVDVWRRAKSLHWDAKRIHSPVWIPVRAIDYAPGQGVVRIPIENRYAFTDLGEIKAAWEIGTKHGVCKLSVPPQTRSHIEVKIPEETSAGSLLVLWFHDAKGALVTACGVTLGQALARETPKAGAGRPKWTDDGRLISIRGANYAFDLNRGSGVITSGKGKPGVALLQFPVLHVARRESRNPFNPNGLSYAQYPGAGTRVIESVTVEPRDGALAITIRDRYAGFAGSVELLVDDAGAAEASFHYAYTGETFDLSEVGLRFLVDNRCREIRWDRKTEWDVYPADHIGRPTGRAFAQPPRKYGTVPFPPYHDRPEWPWHLDMNAFGTRDFRAAKYNIYEAELVSPCGLGIGAYSDGSVNVRACLAPDGVQFHTLLSAIPSPLANGATCSGKFVMRLLPGN